MDGEAAEAKANWAWQRMCGCSTAAKCESVLEQIEASQFCPESTAVIDKWDHALAALMRTWTATF